MKVINNSKSKYLLISLFFISLALPIKPINLFGLEPYFLIAVSVGLLFLWLIVHLFGGDNLKDVDKKGILIVLLFFLWMFITVFYSDQGVGYGLRKYFWLFLGFIAFLFCLTSIKSFKELFSYIFILSIVTFFESLLLIYQRVFSTTWGVLEERTATETSLVLDNTIKVIKESGGTFYNANSLAHWWIFAIFLLISLTIAVYGKRKYRLFNIVLILTMLIALIISLSRASWVGMIVGGAIFLLLSIKGLWRQKKIFYIFFLFILIFISIFSFTDFGNLLEQKVKIKPRLDGREVVNDFGKELFLDNFYLGVGLAASSKQESLAKQYKKELNYRPEESFQPIIHNSYILIGSESGLIGLSLFLLILLTIIYRSLIVYIKNKKKYFWLSVGFIVAFLIEFYIIYFYTFLYSAFLGTLFWSFVGINFAFYNLAKKHF